MIINTLTENNAIVSLIIDVNFSLLVKKKSLVTRAISHLLHSIYNSELKFFFNFIYINIYLIMLNLIVLNYI